MIEEANQDIKDFMKDFTKSKDKIYGGLEYLSSLESFITTQKVNREKQVKEEYARQVARLNRVRDHELSLIKEQTAKMGS